MGYAPYVIRFTGYIVGECVYYCASWMAHPIQYKLTSLKMYHRSVCILSNDRVSSYSGEHR